LIVFARLGPASVVEGEIRVVLVRDGLGRAQEVRAARLRRERHGPRLDAAVESPLPLAEERGGSLDRIVRGVAGQGKRRVLVGDALVLPGSTKQTVPLFRSSTSPSRVVACSSSSVIAICSLNT
jgi:hypothetical protein